jgi:hypothetical protein
VPAPATKAVVYIVRTSSYGAMIGFSYFDSTTYLGKTSGANYVRLEMEPGKHILWARSENRSFVEADLEAGKIYFLEATPGMGLVKAQVLLSPVDPSKDTKTMRRIFKLMEKEQPTTPKMEHIGTNIIPEAMERLKYNREKGENILKLERTQYYTPA